MAAYGPYTRNLLLDEVYFFPPDWLEDETGSFAMRAGATTGDAA